MTRITTLDQLEALYQPAPAPAAIVKVAPAMTTDYRRLIKVSPFAALATIGPEGIDCSPRGDKPGFVRIHDDNTLMMPNRRGNNRIDSLRNIVRDPRCAFLFLIPGSGTTLRVNGRAHLSIDPTLLESFAIEDKAPLGHRLGDRRGLFSVRSGHHPLRALEPRTPCRSRRSAHPRPDPGHDDGTRSRRRKL